MKAAAFDPFQEAKKAFRRVTVIVNPASRWAKEVSPACAATLDQAGIAWQVVVAEKQSVEALAEQARRSGVDLVAVCGGDGTVSQAAGALRHSNIPLAILPGGTANIMAAELEVPESLEGSIALLAQASHSVREVDAGLVDGRCFLLQTGIGLPAQIVEKASPERKAEAGWIAYANSAVEAFFESSIQRYRLTLDGKDVESYGIICFIANSGNLGLVRPLPQARLAPADMRDGWLDVFIIRDRDIESLWALGANVVTGVNQEPIKHWKARKVQVELPTRQIIHYDGEVFESDRVHAEIEPKAVRFLVSSP